MNLKRRKFIFNSLQASLLFSATFELRNLAAQNKKVIPFFFVDGGSPYPRAEDFFPQASNSANFNLPPVLQGFSNLKSDMVVLDGVNINRRGPNAKGNWHVDTVGKVLTAKAIHHNGDENDGLPGGISIDQVIANNLKTPSLEVRVNGNRTSRYLMRANPFATGNRVFKRAILRPIDAWDRLFKNCQPPKLQTNAALNERINRLKANKSVMDFLIGDIARLKRELVGVEKIKLDSHENAIREAERSVAADLREQELILQGQAQSTFDCKQPSNLNSPNIPLNSKAHFDVLYAAFKTEKVGVAGMMHGYSSIQWDMPWLNLTKLDDDVHSAVFHQASSQRSNFIKISQWKWTQIAQFAEKLKNEPGGSLLNKVLIYATSHFGRHHSPDRIPVILIGNAQGQLKTGRVLKVKTDNDKPLTSMAHFAGVRINGIGDNLNCGPLNVLHS